MSSLDEQIAYVARAIDSLRHSVAGPLQSTMNGLFVLHQELSRGQSAPTLALVEAQLDLLRNRLDHLSNLASAMRPALREQVLLTELRDTACSFLHEGIDLVDFEISPSETRAQVDPFQASVALSELLKNAVQHTPPGARVRSHLSLQNGAFLAQVENLGQHPWPSPIEKAFDPIYSSRGRSLGLGLAVAYAVARSHAGHLRVFTGEHHTLVELELKAGDADGR